MFSAISNENCKQSVSITNLMTSELEISKNKTDKYKEKLEKYKEKYEDYKYKYIKYKQDFKAEKKKVKNLKKVVKKCKLEVDVINRILDSNSKKFKKEIKDLKEKLEKKEKVIKKEAFIQTSKITTTTPCISTETELESRIMKKNVGMNTEASTSPVSIGTNTNDEGKWNINTSIVVEKAENLEICIRNQTNGVENNKRNPIDRTHSESMKIFEEHTEASEAPEASTVEVGTILASVETNTTISSTTIKGRNTKAIVLWKGEEKSFHVKKERNSMNICIIKTQKNIEEHKRIPNESIIKCVEKENNVLEKIFLVINLFIFGFIMQLRILMWILFEILRLIILKFGRIIKPNSSRKAILPPIFQLLLIANRKEMKFKAIEESKETTNMIIINDKKKENQIIAREEEENSQNSDFMDLHNLLFASCVTFTLLIFCIGFFSIFIIGEIVIFIRKIICFLEQGKIQMNLEHLNLGEIRNYIDTNTTNYTIDLENENCEDEEFRKENSKETCNSFSL